MGSRCRCPVLLREACADVQTFYCRVLTYLCIHVLLSARRCKNGICRYVDVCVNRVVYTLLKLLGEWDNED